MFRVKQVGEPLAVLCITVVILLVMLAATGATVWQIAEIRKEQRIIQEIVEGGVAEDIERLGTLPGEFRWQYVFTGLVLFVVVFAGGLLVFVVRAYVKSLASLRETKALAWDILESMDQAVITTDRQGRVTSINLRGQQLLDLGFDCIGHPLDGICQRGEPLADMSRDVLRGGEGQHDGFFSITRDGRLLQLRAECHVLRGPDQDISGTVLHVRDVTERLLIEERMRRMERFMGLGTLAAGLHHEIKNPLSALSLHAQLLEERLAGKADEETAQNLSVLKTEITRIAGVLESFRDYASVDRLHRTETDIAGLVRQTVDLIEPQTQQHDVQVDVSIPDAGLSTVLLDATRLEQVLLNLAMNALDEMRDGGKLSVAVDTQDGKLKIAVSDTGRGIPQNVRARILDPYFTTKSDGSGMGLAVCEKIIRQHGGQIDFDTTSSGTTFHISLPMDDH